MCPEIDGGCTASSANLAIVVESDAHKRVVEPTLKIRLHLGSKAVIACLASHGHDLTAQVLLRYVLLSCGFIVHADRAHWLGPGPRQGEPRRNGNQYLGVFWLPNVRRAKVVGGTIWHAQRQPVYRRKSTCSDLRTPPGYISDPAFKGKPARGVGALRAALVDFGVWRHASSMGVTVCERAPPSGHR